MGNDHHQGLLSKIATNEGHGESSSYFDGWKAYVNDPYDPSLNPKGVIQMGLAENQLCHDLFEEWIKKNPEASICTPQGVSQFKDISIFQDYHGLSAFRRAIAMFMGKVRGGRVKFDPDRIVMSGGATGAEELIAFCLADPGDAFLVPTPYYPGFDRDFRWRTGVQLLPVHCKSSSQFMVTEGALRAAYEEAIEADIRVKGVLITNPSNPLGTSMNKETLETILRFTNEKMIHLVCDEVYAGNVFKQPTYISISELIEEKTNYDRGLVHICYSLSKDLGLPGFRVGIVYSYNDAVVSCGRKMSSFGLVSSQTQHMLASMLSDEHFTTKFLEESRKRLTKRHEIFTSGLAQVGIRCIESNAGLFCWMDLRHLLKEATVKGEEELRNVIVNDFKLNVSPGSSFHCMEPGWFRVCFATMDDETMEEALTRIRSFVSQANEVEAQAKKKSWQTDLPSSMLQRFKDGSIHDTTPNDLMSPHSTPVHATS